MKKHGSKKKHGPIEFIEYAIFDSGRFGVPFAPEIDLWELDPQIVLEEQPGYRLRLTAHGPAGTASQAGKLTPYIAHVHGFGGKFKYQSAFIGRNWGDPMKTSALFGYVPRPMILKIRALYTGFYLLYADPDKHLHLERMSEDFARSLLHSSLDVGGFDPFQAEKAMKEKPKTWTEDLLNDESALKPLTPGGVAKIKKAIFTAEDAQEHQAILVPGQGVPAWAAPYAHIYVKLTEESKEMLKTVENVEQALTILGAYAKGLEQGQAAQHAAAQQAAAQQALGNPGLQAQAAGYAGDNPLSAQLGQVGLGPSYESESTMIWEAVHKHAQKGTFETAQARKKGRQLLLGPDSGAPARAPEEEPKRNLKLNQVK